MVRKALGKGLESLLSKEFTPSKYVLLELDVNNLEPNPFQPRKEFNEEHLKELSDSIGKEGILQPLLVRKADRSYEIVAGERRWRAAKMAGLKKVPVFVIEVDDLKLQQIALIENLQREDLAPLEEALAYKNLIDKYSFTQAVLAEQIGKKRSTIANMLRLLQLPEEVKEDLQTGNISVGHAMAVLSVDDRQKQKTLSRAIVKEKMSVRKAESLARKLKESSPKKNVKKQSTNHNQIMRQLRTHFKTKIEIQRKGHGGRLIMDFYSEEDLNRLISLMGVSIES